MSRQEKGKYDPLWPPKKGNNPEVGSRSISEGHGSPKLMRLKIAQGNHRISGEIRDKGEGPMGSHF